MFPWTQIQRAASASTQHGRQSIPSFESFQIRMGNEQAAEPRCDAVTDLMQHTHIQCDRPRGHSGNHHAMVTGNDLHLARDGHTIRATAWQVEWKEDAGHKRAA